MWYDAINNETDKINSKKNLKNNKFKWSEIGISELRNNEANFDAKYLLMNEH